MGFFSQVVAISNLILDDFIHNELHYQIIRITFLVIFIIYFFYGFWLTNCIAGPLFRLKRHMDEVADGKSDVEIHFRKNDYGSELAESFNAVMKSRVQKEPDQPASSD